MLTTHARTHVEATCYCPYCWEIQCDIRNKLTECEYYELRYDKWDIEVEIKCDECEKTFIVDEVEF